MEIAYLVTHKTDISKIAGNPRIKRIYIGDGECEFNLLNNLLKVDIFGKVKDLKKDITLLTPALTEGSMIVLGKFLEKHKEDISACISEIVINDIGLIHKLKEVFGKHAFKIIYGNHLFYQMKDPVRKYLPDYHVRGNISIDFKMYDDFFKEEGITNIELYNAGSKTQMQNTDIGVFMYYPWVVYTTSRYCYRSLLDSEKDLLQIVDKCSGCQNKEHIKFEQDLEDTKIYSVGNKSIYANYERDSLYSVDRVIYNYDLIKS